MWRMDAEKCRRSDFGAGKIQIHPSMSITHRWKHRKSPAIRSKAENFHEKRKILQHLSDSPLLLVNFDIFSAQSRKNKRSERKSEAKKREKCWYPVSMDTPRKGKTFSLILWCAGVPGENFLTQSQIARGLCWCGFFSDGTESSTSTNEMLECSVGVKKKIESLNAHAWESRRTDAFAGLLVCDISVERLLGSIFSRMVFRL